MGKEKVGIFDGLCNKTAQGDEFETPGVYLGTGDGAEPSQGEIEAQENAKKKKTKQKGSTQTPVVVH